MPKLQQLEITDPAAQSRNYNYRCPKHKNLPRPVTFEFIYLQCVTHCVDQAKLYTDTSNYLYGIVYVRLYSKAEKHSA